MRTLGNIIWHIPFLGFLFALAYALGGLFFCITIIGIPIGLGWLQFSLFLLSPFSKAMVSRKDLELLTGQKQGDGMHAFSFIVRILYFPFGLLAAIGALCTIVAEFISLIGIPSGIVWAKSLSTIFNPVNKVCVPRAVAMEIERRKNEGTLNRYASQRTNAGPSGSTVTNNPADKEYIEKALKKSDEELKEIIQSKEDYNPKLVKAAEKVLQARTTGEEIKYEEPESINEPYVYNDNLNFMNVRGEILLMAGVMLPMLSPIILLPISFFIDRFSLGSTSVLWFNFLEAIYYILELGGAFLVFNGWMTIKKDRYLNLGMTFILASTFIIIMECALRIMINYQIISVSDLINDEIRPIFITTTVLYLASLIAGIVLWKIHDKTMNTIGAFIICFATTILYGYNLFRPEIHRYLTDHYNDFTDYENFIITGINIFMPLLIAFGWYKFINLGKPSSKTTCTENSNKS